jgi:hypothetical protein
VLKINEELLSIHKKLREAQHMLVLSRPGPSIVENRSNLTTHLFLNLGNGYFSGVLFTVKYMDEQGNEVEQRMIDRPPEMGIARFCDGEIIDKHEPWILEKT